MEIRMTMLMMMMMMMRMTSGVEAVLVSHTYYEGCMHDPLFSTSNGDSVPNHHDRICWHQNCYT
jgi:hypothetical protein